MAVVRRRADVWTATVASLVTLGTAATAASGTVGALERRVFRFVNGWPDSWEGAIWVLQLPGLLGAPLVMAVGALLLRQWRLVVALIVLIPLKLGVERAVLKALVQRERPGTTIPGAVLRDVPSAGLSFPSGHAIIAFGLVVLLLPYVAGRWRTLVVAVAVLNAVARVYLGAHAPLDVLGGGAAGAVAGAVLNLLVGVRARSAGPPDRERRAE